MHTCKVSLCTGSKFYTDVFTLNLDTDLEFHLVQVVLEILSLQPDP